MFNSIERDPNLKMKWVNNHPEKQVNGKFWCAYCGKWYSYKKTQIDHIEAFSNGGHNKDSNLVPSCIECNQHKSAKKESIYFILGKTYTFRFWINRIIEIIIENILILIGSIYLFLDVIPNYIPNKYKPIVFGFLIISVFWKLNIYIYILKLINPILNKIGSLVKKILIVSVILIVLLIFVHYFTEINILTYLEKFFNINISQWFQTLV